ncbi:MAG: hypothetical protein HY069_03310 [Chlamydiia bacterium]|nr:hypothetical protein [Chlamydiia bacterium]
MATAVLSPIVLGSFSYKRESNPDAGSGPIGRAASVGSTALGTYYALSAMKEFNEVLGGSQAIGSMAGTSAQVMQLPRAIEASRDAFRGWQNLRVDNPNAEQLHRRVLAATKDTADAVSNYTGNAAFIAKHVLNAPGPAQTFTNVSTCFSLVDDTIGGRIHGENMIRAGHLAQEARNQQAPADTVNAFVYTQRYSLISLCKAVVSVALGIIAVWGMLFKATMVSALALSCLAPALGLWALLYRASMPSKPIDMHNYTEVKPKTA